jgi:ArsR family transcriptional regulator
MAHRRAPRANAPRGARTSAGRRPGDGVVGLETVFKALADRTRLRILGLLVGGDVCVCDIHESLGIPQPRASRHLAYLRRAGLVDAHRRGLWVHYRLATLPDDVAAAIVAAVVHGLGHLPAVARDRRRLARRTGCCPPLEAAAAVSRLAVLSCCAKRGEAPAGFPVGASTAPMPDPVAARADAPRS